jgi:hypothetical protein
MNYPRCPELDRLGRELIEAYRRAEERELFCLTAEDGTRSEIATFHLSMAEHRTACHLCQMVTQSIKSVATSNVPFQR